MTCLTYTCIQKGIGKPVLRRGRGGRSNGSISGRTNPKSVDQIWSIDLSVFLLAYFNDFQAEQADWQFL